jgi:hypothetical protein
LHNWCTVLGRHSIKKIHILPKKTNTRKTFN